MIGVLPSLCRVKGCEIDAGRSVVRGSGIESCVVGEGDDARGNNVIVVSCVDDGGEAADGVSEEDVDVIVRGCGDAGGDGKTGVAVAVGGAGGDEGVSGAIVGGVLSRVVKGDGVIEIVYGVRGE